MSPKVRARLIGLTLAALSLWALYASRSTVGPWAVRWLDVGVLPQQAEYVLVLGGSEVLRPEVAACIIRAGLAHEALVPRVYFPPDVDDGIHLPPHKVTRAVLAKRGVPDANIVDIGRDIRTTHDEAAALAEFLAGRPSSKTLVVTSDYHTRRARWIFSLVLGHRASDISIVSAPVEEFSAETWWQHEDGFQAIISEYLKLLAYAVWYRPIWSSVIALVLGLLAWGTHRGSRAACTAVARRVATICITGEASISRSSDAR